MKSVSTTIGLRCKSALTGSRAASCLLSFVIAPAFLFPVAEADTYQWNGSASSAWSNPANWNPSGTPAGVTAGPAPTGGNFNHRLNVNNAAANGLIHDASLGASKYGGAGIRGLVVGSGSSGNMRITGGTFDTTNSDAWDVVGSTSNGLLAIDDGVFMSNRLMMGLNNGSGSGTLTVNGGLAVIDSIQFNYQSSGGTGTINLNGGTLATRLIHESTTGTNGNHVINFNGGVLRASASNSNFLTNSLARANVRNGGAKVDTNGFDITIGQSLIHSLIIGDSTVDGGLLKSGQGKLELTNSNSYNGGTVIESGTLALGASSSISGTASVSVISEACFDVSAHSTYVWPQGTALIAQGGEIKAGISMDLGSAPLHLQFSPGTFSGDTSHPSLTFPAGSVTINGPIQIHNSASSPLGEGIYRLITLGSGILSGTPGFGGSVTGQGIEAGKFCFLQIDGGNLNLVVQGPAATSTTLLRHPGTNASSTYGDTLQLIVNVSPPSATGTVELFDGGIGGTLVGSAELSDGSAVVTPAETALAPGNHAALVARYVGNAAYLTSMSGALMPAQVVAAKPLSISDATALDKYYDATTTAAISGTLVGVETNDSVTLTASGVFASPNAGTNIPVTSTSVISGASASNYSLVQPAGLSADIIASNVWTGGVGGSGTNLATGTNYSPTAIPANVYNAIFNGVDLATIDLTLGSAIGGAVNTSGMVFGFSGSQTAPVTISGSTGASARIASVIVAPGAGAVTFQGTLPFILGGPLSDSIHSFINHSASPLVFQNTGNWIPGGSGSYLRSMIFDGTGDIMVSSNIVPSTPSRVSLTKQGTGSLTLSGANTFSGGTSILEGKMTASTLNALGTGAVVNQGTLALAAGAGTYTGLSSSLSGAGVVNVSLGTGSATTPLNGNYSNFTGTWNIGTGAAVGAGKTQMNGPDHPAATIHVLENATLYTTSGNHAASLVLYGGNTGESLGQLRIEGSATWSGGITLAGPITGTGDGHIGAASGTGTISGMIGETGGAHGLVKDGDGTIILTGNNTYTGPTSVNDGVLLVNSPGSLAPGSAVTVASGATLGGDGLIGGSLAISAGATLDPGRLGSVTLTVAGPVVLNGTTLFKLDRSEFPASARLLSNSSIGFGGTLRVINEGPPLKIGDSFQIFTTPSFTGSFASVLLPPLGYDLMWDTGSLTVDGTIRVVSAVSQDHPVITLSPGTFHQQMFGIGGNFCQGEQNVLLAYNRFDEMFGPDGLNMSFIRISTAHELTEPGFASFDANNVTTVQEFRARQPNGRVMLTTWTPPESLKSTNSPYQGTLAKTPGGQYRYSDYGAWWTRALQFYQNNGVLPDYVSIQNECDFTPTPPSSGSIPAYIAGCYLNSTETTTKAGYSQALAAVRSAFATAGLGSMKMIGPDTTAIAGDKVKSYMDIIPSGQIDAIAHHLYHDSPGSTGIADLTRLQTLYPYWVMPKFMTELNPHDTYEDWDPAQPGWMQLAVTMHNVFTYERANTYMVWSSMYGFIDRFTGLPNNANYYALAHFSRFVNANNWRVAASSNDPELLVTHYRHYGGPGISDRQIVVLINKASQPKHATIGTAASWSSNPAQRAWQVHQTANDGSATKRITMTEIDQGPWLSGDRQLVLPPHSLTTALVNTGTATSEYSHQQVWRFQHFGTLTATGSAADDSDPDEDGESNLYEFATGQNPHAATRLPPVLSNNGTNLKFTYTRSKAAVLDGLAFTVEWSDSLAPGSWSTLGITESTEQESNTLESRRALVPKGESDGRFVRLRIGF